VTPARAADTRNRGRSPGAGSDGPKVTAWRSALPPGDPIDPWVLAVGDDAILLADGGRVLVGLGTALRLDLSAGLDDAASVDRASRRLAAVGCEDRLAVGATPLRAVLALGALPFDRDAAGALVVPATLYCREPDGSEWVTVVSGPGDDQHADPGRVRRQLLERCRRATTTATATPTASWRVVPRDGDAGFEDRVSEAVAAIGRQEVDKVVLSRRVDVTADRPPDVGDLLRRWADLEPSCTLFSVPTPDGRFVGASPELLVERHGTTVTSRPLAGTTDREPQAGSSLPVALLDSAKDAEEHRWVVDAICEALTPWSDRLEVPDGPELVYLHNITHLGTSIEATLHPGPDGGMPSVLSLVALLHPTPAVGGVPRNTALDLIGRLERGSRGPYAGPVGWMDGAGDGRWVVGIRAMTVDGATATLSAGAGIVAGSRPDVERRETDLKFTAVFDALAPGVPFDVTAPGITG
jgi:isochorismate synthase